MDHVLTALYDSDRKGSLGSSSPNVNKWLGDIRTYFPTPVVQIMQKDAIEKLNIKKILTEPELLEQLEPDVNLAATLLTLGKNLPEKTKETARNVVQKIVTKLQDQLQWKFQQSFQGRLLKNQTRRTQVARDLDWNKIILKNLKHYQPQFKTIIPEILYGYRRNQQNKRDIILCLDQSGSMATSVVYTGIIASVMSYIPSMNTKLLAFDTNVVDLTDLLHDPVELLFGVQLGGGTHIYNALAHAQTLVDQPEKTTLILISDLFEGTEETPLMAKLAELQQSGIQIIILLALSDEGKPSFDKEMADFTSKSLQIPTFACSPDLFPDLMSHVLNGFDVQDWVADKKAIQS